MPTVDGRDFAGHGVADDLFGGVVGDEVARHAQLQDGGDGQRRVRTLVKVDAVAHGERHVQVRAFAKETPRPRR